MTDALQAYSIVPWWAWLYFLISMLAFAFAIIRAKIVPETSNIDYVLFTIALPETLIMGLLLWVQDRRDMRKFDREMKKLKAEGKA